MAKFLKTPEKQIDGKNKLPLDKVNENDYHY